MEKINVRRVKETEIPQRKLGLRPPSNAPAIEYADIRRKAPRKPAVDFPLIIDHYSKVKDFGMYQNNRYGVCGPTSVAHSIKIGTRYLTTEQFDVSQTDLFDLYRRSGNPSFNPVTGGGDNGVVMQDMLDELRANGIGGKRPIAFARIDVRNPDHLREASYVFGSLLYGLDLDEAQDSQTDTGLWDYVPRSPKWGGHAVCYMCYDNKPGTANDLGTIVTWDKKVEITNTFVEHQLGEAWVVIWEWNLGTIQFAENVDISELAYSFKYYTNDVLPILIPTPNPIPTPIPTPSLNWWGRLVQWFLGLFK